MPEFEFGPPPWKPLTDAQVAYLKAPLKEFRERYTSLCPYDQQHNPHCNFLTGVCFHSEFKQLDEIEKRIDWCQTPLDQREPVSENLPLP